MLEEAKQDTTLLPNRQQTDHEYDVTIIGAGFAGLSAALYLKDCNINNVLVLEANNRVGGRVSTDYIQLNDKEYAVDTGGTYTGFGQNKILKMAQRYQVKTYKIYEEGKTIINNKGDIIASDSVQDGIRNIFNFIDMNYIMQNLFSLASKVEEFDDESIKKYDSITVSEYFESLMPHNADARDMLQAFISTLSCLPASKWSVYALLIGFKESGANIQALTDSQSRKFIGGTHSICVKMMEEIDATINLNHIVQCIEYDRQNGSKCVVKCTNGNTFCSKYIILCIAPTSYDKIEFKPLLCQERQNIIEKMTMGYAIKANVFYETAFWREIGSSGTTFTIPSPENNEVPLILTLDDVKPDDTCPSLVIVIAGEKAIDFGSKYDKEQRKKIILEQLMKLFNDERAMNECIGYIEKIWHHEQFSVGGYCAVPDANTLSLPYYDVIRQSERNRLFFASTELATKWSSYIDGAIQSGQREANKIAKLLENESDDNITIVQFYDDEPVPQDLDFGSIDFGESPWILRNFPNSRSLQKGCCCCCVFILIGVVVAIISTL